MKRIEDERRNLDKKLEAQELRRMEETFNKQHIACMQSLSKWSADPKESSHRCWFHYQIGIDSRMSFEGGNVAKRRLVQQRSELLAQHVTSIKSVAKTAGFAVREGSHASPFGKRVTVSLPVEK